MSSTGKDSWVPEIWSKKTLEVIHNISVMRPLVNTDYEGEIKKAGDLVYARLPVAVTVNSYTRETNITYEALTVTAPTFAIDQQKYFAFKLDDLDNAQLDLDFMELEKQEAAIAIRDTIDTRLLSHYANTDASNVIGSTSAAIPLTKDNIYSYFTKTKRLLMDQKAMAKSVAVVPPYIGELIVNSPEMSTRGTNLVDETVQNGLMAKNFGGHEVHVTTNMATVSGTYPLMFFTKRFISFAMQFENVEKVRLVDQIGDGVRGVYLYGSTVFTNYDGDGAVLYASAS